MKSKFVVEVELPFGISEMDMISYMQEALIRYRMRGPASNKYNNIDFHTMHISLKGEGGFLPPKEGKKSFFQSRFANSIAFLLILIPTLILITTIATLLMEIWK